MLSTKIFEDIHMSTMILATSSDEFKK